MPWTSRVLLSLHLLTATGMLGAAVTWAAPVRADASNQAAEVLLVLENLPANLDPEQVRAAIAREVGASVTLVDTAPSGANALTLYGDDGQRIRLSYLAADGRGIERDIDLPDAPDRAVELVALLAGNLARDEAAEIGAAFKKRSEKPPPAAKAPTQDSKPRVAEPPLRARAPVPQRFATVDLLPFVGTSSFAGVGASRRFSLNVLAGMGAGVEGLEIGGLVNIDSARVHGAQIAGLANVTLGPVEGAQLAGLTNIAQRLDGIQAGLGNAVSTDALGLQVGLVDLTGGELQGAQIGLVNIGGGSVKGAQIGLVNIATGSVKGAQIGLLNIAPSSTFSLGLLGIFPRGRLHLDLWGQESGLLMAGIKHGSGHFHSIYGAGLRSVGDRVRLAISLGFGARFPLSNRWFLDVDLLDYGLFGASAFEVVVNLAQARVVLGGRPVEHLAIFGGPSYNVAASFDGQEPGLSPYGVNFTAGSGKNLVQGWPGLVLGVQGL